MFPLDFFTRIMAEKALDDVLRHLLVDQPGPEGVPELVRCHLDRPAGAVVEPDAGLPVLERPAEHPVAVGLAGVPPGREQPA